MTSLWLMRHPEPEDSARGHCYGALDVSLSAAGLRRAQAVARSLRAAPFAAIYTSPSQRCQKAAEILSFGRACPLTAMPELAELNFGEFEGRTYDEIAASHRDLYKQWMSNPTEVAFPGGESFGAMSARVTGAAKCLRERHSGETIAIVTHGGPIRVIVADALGMPAANIFRIAQRDAAINLVRYFGALPKVEILNAETRALE